MKHLLAIEELDREEIEAILDRAESFAEVGRRDIKKVPTLRGRTVVTLFYESSTRTSSSFELAAKRLSADLVSVKAAGSSVDKGESLKDTVATLSAYDPAAIVIRHPYAGAAQLVAGWTDAAVVNAGDGKHEHPSQALLDVYTLRRRLGSLEGARIWIVGDVLHSRVARSNLIAFQAMGAEVTLCGPPTLIPRGIEELGCEVSHSLDAARGGRRRLRAADAARADGRRASSPRSARVRGALPDRHPPARAAPAADAPGPGQPRRRALRRGDRLAAVADRRAGRRRAWWCGWRSSTSCWPGSRSGRPRSASGAAAGSRHADDRTAGVSATREPDRAARRPRRASAADLVLRARPCSTRSPGSTASTTWSSAAGGSPSSLAPGEADADRRSRSSTPRACTPSPPSSTRTSTCAPPATSTRRTSRPAPAPLPPAASAGSSRWPTPSRRSPTPADVEALREQARARPRVPVGFLATVTRRHGGRAS